MDFKDYLDGINRTWKKDTYDKEIAHCLLAIGEEIGEIAGWYKKVIGFGNPKDIEWKKNLIGEFGDLLYYLTKYSQLINKLYLVEHYFEENAEKNVILDPDIVGIMSDLEHDSSVLKRISKHNIEIVETLNSLFTGLTTLMQLENVSMEYVQLSNLRKLKVRHPDGYNEASSKEEGRDRDAELDVL